jgi:hypothetical protein
LNHIQCYRFIVVTAGFSNLDSHFFTFKRTKYEYGFAVDMGDTTSFVRHGFDMDYAGFRELSATTPFGH